MIIYKGLPTFYFHCGLVGHGANNCNRKLEKSPVDVPMEYPLDVSASFKGDSTSSGPSTIKQAYVGTFAADVPQDVNDDPQCSEFGSWMLATHGRSRGRGRGGADSLMPWGGHVAHVPYIRREGSNPTVEPMGADSNIAVG